MDKYLSRYITNFNKYIANDHIQYSIKGSLCLYYHYLLYHKLPNNFEQPMDIDVDVFSIVVDPIEILENVIVCKKAIINIISVFFPHLKNNINFKTILKKAYETNNEQTLITNDKTSEKINIYFEKFNERTFFGKRSIVSYAKLVFKFFDNDNNNYIDLFMENITPIEFNDLKNHIELITYENKSYYVLSFSSIIKRYYSMYENANKDRLKKLPKDILRFEDFFATTKNKEYKELTYNLLNFLKKSQIGGNEIKYKYKINKYKYNELKNNICDDNHW